MNLQNRIKLIQTLSDYLKQNDTTWQEVKQYATAKNPWFTESFINLAVDSIVENYLEINSLHAWISHYQLNDLLEVKNIGIVMAGNIPMVGFHDFLTTFISGHRQTIKFSSKDDLLLKHLIHQMFEWNEEAKKHIEIAEQLKGCDAYIATGGSQSALFFEQYFAKYPSIIRKNRTSVAILTGDETMDELKELSKDIHYYFGLGCRNVTKLYVPENYNFIPLLESFKEFSYFRDYNKYTNNYDYQLSILLLNNVYYMTNESTILVENESIFSPISVLHYEYYKENPFKKISQNDQIQCIVGKSNIPFGTAQKPSLFTYADGVDTMKFLLEL